MPRSSLYSSYRAALFDALGRLSESGRAPTIRELAEECGLAPPTVHKYLRMMADEGLVDWYPKSHRSVRIRRGAPEPVE